MLRSNFNKNFRSFFTRRRQLREILWESFQFAKNLGLTNCRNKVSTEIRAPIKFKHRPAGIWITGIWTKAILRVSSRSFLLCSRQIVKRVYWVFCSNESKRLVFSNEKNSYNRNLCSVQWGSEYLPFEYRKCLEDVPNFLKFFIRGLVYVLCPRLTIWVPN